MEIKLYIDGSEPDPKLGIINGYVEEGINRVSLVELLVVTEHEFTEEELEEMVGKPATLGIMEAVDRALKISRFDGLIYEFHEPNQYHVAKDRYIYRLVIRPKVWLLNIGCNARSFVDKSHIEVIKQVLEEYNLTAGNHFETFYYNEADYPKLNQILQCEVSDWEFIRRLMLEAGINFYFGAEKDGENEEKLRLIDKNVFYPKGYEEKIPWNPSPGQVQGRQIESFETRVRTVPRSVNVTAVFGDGQVKTYSSKKDLPKGQGSDYYQFCSGGQDEKVAKRAAMVLSEGFESFRVTYEGESNHFLIRAGERFIIENTASKKQKKFIVTSIIHKFNQTVDAAFGNDPNLDYGNKFTAVRENAEIRPVPVERTIDARLDSARPTPVLEVGETERKKKPLETTFSGETNLELVRSVQRLLTGQNNFGVMLGIVIEDAKVSDGKEMNCRVKNERFPDGLTIKVLAPWLVPGGGVTTLPRVGMQVYFMLVQGEGGGHEGIMLGYRPSGKVPGLDPANQTETATLKAGPKPELDKPADPVVEKSSISPSNRQRNALAGEEGVAEMAVIDGPEASVSVTADKTITLTAKENTNISSANHMQKADMVNLQFGELITGISGDSTESIGGNNQLSIMSNQTMYVSGNIERTIKGNVEETVEGNKVWTVSGDMETSVSGNETITISENQDTSVIGDAKYLVSGNSDSTVSGNSTEKVEGNESVEISGNQDTQVSGNIDVGCTNMSISANGEVSIAGMTKIELTCGAGSFSIDAAGNVKINGIMVDITGSAPVTITGAMVKLNS